MIEEGRFMDHEKLSRRTILSGLAASPLAFSSAPPADTRILTLTSTSDVSIPTNGRAFMKFSFDFPEPSIEFEGLRIGLRVFSFENVYSPNPDTMTVATITDGLEVHGKGFTWAGGQEKADGEFRLVLRKAERGVEVEARASMPRRVKSLSVVVRDVPRGELSGGGQAFFDPHDDEVLFGYPFSAGDLQLARGMESPLAIVRTSDRKFFYLSARDEHVRAKRFYFQPGPKSYRVELVFEGEGWVERNQIEGARWSLGWAATMEEAARPHYAWVERAHSIPNWETRPDVPDWTRSLALAVTLHGMHYTGYIFNDYARMAKTLEWISQRIPAQRVLAFISAWDGRYYWDYPLYRPVDRMGGEAGFRTLVQRAHDLGFHVMPMFGTNAANRRQPVFSRFADAATAKIDGDPMELNWVDWDNDRHQEGWLAYMNVGVPSWRNHLTARIADIIDRFGVDAYFLDIAGGWTNNPKADMHEGLRLMVGDLRRRYPAVLACGEMHYDALLAFLPFYHAFSQLGYPPAFQKYSRAFYHLSQPAPGRGSTGVHEFGFNRWDDKTLGIRNDFQIPTLNVVDDTLDRYPHLMEALINRAKERARL
jgi:hypothetical protein